LIKEAMSICRTNFECFEFSFDRRACNTVAHELAIYGANLACADSFWWPMPPFV
jgi:hypothetical protein